MRLTIVALGTRMPGWVNEAVAEYRKRFPAEISLSVRELPLAQRGRDKNTGRILAREAEAIRRAMAPRDRLIALDVSGRMWSTEQLAGQLADWQRSGDNYSLVIGGPDGLDPALLNDAHQRWSLSALTLPHPLVRIVLVEQLYRAWTINARHPYHRS